MDNDERARLLAIAQELKDIAAELGSGARHDLRRCAAKLAALLQPVCSTHVWSKENQLADLCCSRCGAFYSITTALLPPVGPEEKG